MKERPSEKWPLIESPWMVTSPLVVIEPVSTGPRNLLTLELHNVADTLRQPASYATNHRHDWVMRARRRQLREPWVRYGPRDLVAIAQVLSRQYLPGELPLDGSVAVNLVPGEHPIIPVMLGDAKIAAEFAQRLLNHGVYVIGFSFPVVPRGQARIRTQMSAAHTFGLSWSRPRATHVTRRVLPIERGKMAATGRA